IESQRMSVGGVTTTVVDHRLVIKRALELLAPQIIMVHNHPSGSIEPSPEDVELTERVRLAAELFDIKLLDHIIVGRTGDYSFRGSNLL
ncbi:MAG: JAB domain-containing protein, partial [Rikenellaceae bacterium]